MSATPPVKTRHARQKVHWAPYAFLALPVAYSLALSAAPLAKGFELSLTNAKLLNPSRGRFIGLQNYQNLLTKPEFGQAVLTTLLYTMLVVVFAVLVGTVAALVVNRAFPGRAVVRAMLTIPWAVPTVAVALIFTWIYNEGSGILNEWASAVGLGRQGWLTDPSMAMFSVVVATLWKVTPFVMLVMLAALQSVPEELIEAARVDGAGSIAIFRVVTVPAIMPTLRIVVLLMTIWSFRRFEIIWLLTGGGPVNATNTIVIDVYRTAFNNNDLGLASAIGMLGVVMSVLVTIAYARAESQASAEARR